MSFHMRLDDGIVLFVPDNIKCCKCKRYVPIQQYCIKCGEEFTPRYIGEYVERISGLLSADIMNHYRSKG
jgi:primosomal protein N'